MTSMQVHEGDKRSLLLTEARWMTTLHDPPIIRALLDDCIRKARLQRNSTRSSEAVGD